jgi:outer membrane protein insertion porin family
VDFGSLRFSAGVGVAWISPLGPMKFSYAYPINSEEGDRIQRFQFQIGTGF